MKLAGERIGGGKLLAAVAAAVMGVVLLTCSDDLAQGIAQGLQISGNVLIPSLFPFMILCTYLVLTDGARILSIPLRPLTKYLLRLPPEYGAVVFASLIGGYPVGGKMISGLVRQGGLDKPTAQRMMAFCFGPSPAFMITAVGAGILLDRRLGVMLFCAQIIASLGVGFILSLGVPLPQKKKHAAKGRERGRGFYFGSDELLLCHAEHVRLCHDFFRAALYDKGQRAARFRQRVCASAHRRIFRSDIRVYIRRTAGREKRGYSNQRLLLLGWIEQHLSGYCPLWGCTTAVADIFCGQGHSLRIIGGNCTYFA